MKEMIHTTHYVILKIDVLKIIFLLTAASALVEISMATTVAKDNKGGYIALMTDAQQLSEAAMQLKQQKQQQLPVEPFNFANLRRLHLKYKNGQSYANRRQGQQQVEAEQLRKEQQQQQQQPQRQKQQQLQQKLEQQELQQRLQQQQPRKQQWQQISPYNNKEQRDQDNNDVDDSDNDNENENSRSAERESGMESRNNDKDDNGYLYYRYLYSDDNNNKQPNGNGNPKRDDDDDDGYDDDNYDYQELQNRQEGRNSFRLQLSGSNEPFRSTNSNNNRNNNNNVNKNHNNNINEIHNNSENNNIDADDDNDDDTVTKANNKSFSDQDQDSDMSFGDVEFYDDPEVSLPYGIQNVKRVPQRNVNYVGKTTTFQSLCPTKRVSIPLDTSAYEYRPNHYIEVTCAHVYPPTENIEGPNKNRICSEAGFSCVQLNRTIHLIRRNKAAISSRFSADCWESEVRIVSSGCECMWPKHHYGDIVTYHHQEQKRHQLSWGELADVKENEDYAEISINGDAYKMIQRRADGGQ